jgi:hypothetical protein
MTMSNAKEKVIKVIDFVTIAVAIAICVVAFIIDGYNSIMNNSITIDYSFVATTFLLAIAMHFILSGFIQSDISKKQDKIEADLGQAVSTIINSLNGIEIQFFDDIVAVDLYISKRIGGATKSVYDFNWQDFIRKNPRPRNAVDREYTENEMDKNIKSFCQKKKPRIYKEIFTFSYINNIKKMQKHITYGDCYSCSYYDNKLPESQFPKLQYVVIDDEEVIFVSSAYIPNLFSVKNKRIVSLFSYYFEQAWSFSKIIKDDQTIRCDVIEEIVNKYSEPY